MYFNDVAVGICFRFYPLLLQQFSIAQQFITMVHGAGRRAYSQSHRGTVLHFPDRIRRDWLVYCNLRHIGKRRRRNLLQCRRGFRTLFHTGQLRHTNGDGFFKQIQQLLSYVHGYIANAPSSFEIHSRTWEFTILFYRNGCLSFGIDSMHKHSSGLFVYVAQGQGGDISI